MNNIPKDLWLENSFAQVTTDLDLLRLPEPSYASLSPAEKDRLRQTEVFAEETVQVLGHHEHHGLVKKFDGTLGWVPREALRPRDGLTGFDLRYPARVRPETFLDSWKGTPYVWGGLSMKGIDCSGFTQLYYLHVHGLVLPKNSHDQRKLGKERPLADLKDHDLIFCYANREGAAHQVVATTWSSSTGTASGTRAGR